MTGIWAWEKVWPSDSPVPIEDLAPTMQQPALSRTSSIESSAPSDEELRSRLLAAIADDTRLRILGRLRRPAAVHRLCRELQLAQPRVSHHLAVLRECGLVEAERRGRERLYRWAEPPPGGPLADVQSLMLKWLGQPTAGPPDRQADRTRPDAGSPPPERPTADSPAKGEDAPESSTAHRSGGSGQIEDFLL